MEGLRGRSRELSTLTDAFRAACVGQAGAVLVGGDAGVGKTKLVGELVRQARRADAVVLTGSAIDIADAPPFWPVLSALRTAVRSRPDDDIGALLTKWLERLPSARGDGPPVRLLDLLHQTITELAELRPVLLVVEDLHWADRSTRDLVAYLVAILTYEPVLVVATFRNDTPGASPDLVVALAELRRHQKVTALELAPLPRDVLAELVAEWAPGRSDLEELVWQRSAGNAFIAEETVRAVLGGDAHGLPPTLREVVLSRIAVLSADGQQVVRAIAAAAGPPRHQLLADVLGLPAATLLEALREAVAHGVVVVDESGEGYRLRHGLMTEVVAADLLPGERLDLHRRFALALAGSGQAAQLAHHWYEAGDAEQALEASVAAAWASEGVHAYTEAHRHWLRAAELAAGPRRAEYLDRAARAAEFAGDHDQAVRLLDQLLDSRRARRDGDRAAARPQGQCAARRGPGHGGGAELRGRRRAAPRLRRRGRAGPGARRAQRGAAAVAGVRGRAHGRAAGVGAGPRGGGAHRRGADPGRAGLQPRLPRGRDRGRRRPRRGRGRGGEHRRAGGHHRGPRAPRRAARRAAEPARRGHRLRAHGPGAHARAGPGPHRGRRAAHLRRQRAVPDGRVGRGPERGRRGVGRCGRPARPRWTCGWPAAASTSPGATSTTPRPTWRPSSCWPGRPPARGSASRCWCCSPRSRCGAAAPRWRWRTSRTGSPWSRRARTTSWPWPRWCGTRRGRGPTW